MAGVNVADLYATLRFEAEGARQVQNDIALISRAQEALNKEVENSSESLKLNQAKLKDSVDGYIKFNDTLDNLDSSITQAAEALNIQAADLEELTAKVKEYVSSAEGQAEIERILLEKRVEIEAATQRVTKEQEKLNQVQEIGAGSSRQLATEVGFYTRALLEGNVTQSLANAATQRGAQALISLGKTFKAAKAAGVGAFQAIKTSALGVGAAIKAALGPLLVLTAAISAAFAIYNSWKRKNEETERAIKSLTKTMIEHRQEWREFAANDLLNQWLDDMPEIIDILNKMGVSVQEFVDIAAGGRDSVTQFFKDALDSGKIGGADFRFLTEQIVDLEGKLGIAADRFNAFATQERLAAEYAGFLAKSIEEVPAGLLAIVDGTDAMSRILTTTLQAINDEFARTGDLEAYFEALSKLPVAGQRWADTLEVVKQELEETSIAARDTAEAIDEQVNAMNSAIDGGFSLIDSVINLAEAYQAVQEESNAKTQLDYAKALRQVEVAANSLGEGGLETLRQNLIRQYQAGLLSAEGLATNLAVIDAVSGVASPAARSLKTITEAIAIQGNTAADAGNVNIAYLKTLAALNKGVSLALNLVKIALRGFSSGLKILGQFTGINFSGLTSGIDNAIGALSGFDGQIDALIGSFPSLIGGLDSVGGSVSDAGAEFDDAADAAAEFVSRMQEGISVISGAASATFGLRDAQDALVSAQERLADLQTISPDEIVAIERAEEQVWLAKQAYDAGLISAAQYAAVQQDLADIQKAAQGDAAAIAQAQDDVLSAQLSLIDAWVRLMSAGSAFNDLTDDQITAFRAVAKMAGLTNKEIDELIDTYGAYAGLASTEGPLFLGGNAPGIGNLPGLPTTFNGAPPTVPDLNAARLEIGNLTFNIKASWPIDDAESRKVAERIRQALNDLEMEAT